MPCLQNYTLKGVGFDCTSNLAGVKKLLLAYYGDVVPDVNYDAQTVTGYTLVGDAEWYEYDFAKNTASLTSELVKDEVNGNRYYTHTISAVFNKLQAANHIEMQAIAGEKMVALVETYNGEKWYLCVDGPVVGSTQEAGTGVSSDDRNGYTMTLECNSAYLPFKYTGDDPEPTNYIRVYSDATISSSSRAISYSVQSTDNWTARLTGNGLSLTQTGTGTGTGSFSVPANTGETPITYTITVWVTDTPSVSNSTSVVQQGEAPVFKYVQDLIDEGYATVTTGAGGSYISILSGCPYASTQILDLEEVARNTKKLTGTTANVIVWDQPKATGFSDNAIAKLYTGTTLNFSPRGGLLWGLGNINSFSITFTGGGWIAADYPWGSYQSEGVFAPRWNSDNENYYASAGFRNTPKNLTVTISTSYSTIGQVMFTMMKTTTAFTLNVNGFDCHDVTGMFEADNSLVTLNINGMFYWSSFRTMHNLFDGCSSLTGIPYCTEVARDNNYNTIYPHHDGVRGSANCSRMFNGCTALTYLGPRVNMAAISLNGCTVDNIQQSALTGVMFVCPNLTDVRLINVGNNSWNFADSESYLYLPKMDVASIEYLLNNVKDETGNGYTLTFSTLHQGQISSSAISNATSKGWTIAYA